MFGSSLWLVLFARFHLHQQLNQCKSNYTSCLLISRALTHWQAAYLSMAGASAFLGGRTGTPQKLLVVGEGVQVRESSAGSPPQQRGYLLGAAQGNRIARCPGGGGCLLSVD